MASTTRRALPKVKSSARTARQPEVPNSISPMTGSPHQACSSGRALSAPGAFTAENWPSMISAHLSRGSVGLSRVLSRVVLATALAAPPVREIRGDSPALKLKLPRLDSPSVEIYPLPALPDEPVKRAVFERINRDRAAAGLPVVEWDEAASKVADDFCARQVAEKSRGHFLTNGVPPYARMGFDGVFGMQLENSVSWITTAARFSEPILRLALEGHEDMLGEKPPSDGHRKTILDPDATHVGVGFAAENGRFQMAQEFLVRGLARLSLSAVRSRRTVQFEGRPLGRSTLAFVTVAHEPPPRALSGDEASGRRSYAYPQPALSFVPEGRRLMRVAGTTSEDRLKIHSNRSFSFEFLPSREGLYTFVFYLSANPARPPRPGGAASFWFE